jgi:hypothetical protein
MCVYNKACSIRAVYYGVVKQEEPPAPASAECLWTIDTRTGGFRNDFLSLALPHDDIVATNIWLCARPIRVYRRD